MLRTGRGSAAVVVPRWPASQAITTRADPQEDPQNCTGLGASVPAARFVQADMAGPYLRPASADAVVAFY